MGQYNWNGDFNVIGTIKQNGQPIGGGGGASFNIFPNIDYVYDSDENWTEITFPANVLPKACYFTNYGYYLYFDYLTKRIKKADGTNAGSIAIDDTNKTVTATIWSAQIVKDDAADYIDFCLWAGSADDLSSNLGLADYHIIYNPIKYTEATPASYTTTKSLKAASYYYKKNSTISSQDLSIEYNGFKRTDQNNYTTQWQLPSGSSSMSSSGYIITSNAINGLVTFNSTSTKTFMTFPPYIQPLGYTFYKDDEYIKLGFNYATGRIINLNTLEDVGQVSITSSTYVYASINIGNLTRDRSHNYISYLVFDRYPLPIDGCALVGLDTQSGISLFTDHSAGYNSPSQMIPVTAETNDLLKLPVQAETQYTFEDYQQIVYKFDPIIKRGYLVAPDPNDSHTHKMYKLTSYSTQDYEIYGSTPATALTTAVFSNITTTGIETYTIIIKIETYNEYGETNYYYSNTYSSHTF